MPTAITGGIAEGKSTVLAYLAECGFKTISADEVARELFLRSDVQQQLAQASELALPIDRADLRDHMIRFPDIRRSVNRVMHLQVTDALLASDAEYAEVPLLIETCTHGAFDSIWVVSCGPEEQRKRLAARYGASADLERILATQMPTKAKLPFADVVIRTNWSLESVRRSISEALDSRMGQS